jgi:hypothetical protein
VEQALDGIADIGRKMIFHSAAKGGSGWRLPALWHEPPPIQPLRRRAVCAQNLLSRDGPLDTSCSLRPHGALGWEAPS